MTVIMFWNINGQPIEDYVGLLCRIYQADIVVLAETTDNRAKIVDRMNKDGEFRYQDCTQVNKYIQVITKLPLANVKVLDDGDRYCIFQVIPIFGKALIVAAVHLRSKMRATDATQRMASSQLLAGIKEVEKNCGHSNSIVIGDMNMNPFEEGMVSADFIHAISARGIARKVSRTVAGEKSDFFYNPMWSFFGDHSAGPPGTYYKNTGEAVNYYWNIFDQVLLRPALIEDFRMENLTVVTQIGEKSLLKGNGIDTSISDHLPIVLGI